MCEKNVSRRQCTEFLYLSLGSLVIYGDRIQDGTSTTCQTIGSTINKN